MSTTFFHLHKRPSVEYKNIQDKSNFNSANKCIALADGTTQSFNSELWAELITETFVNDPHFDIPLLIESFRNCVQKFKKNRFIYSDNPARASLEKEKQKIGATLRASHKICWRIDNE